MRRLTTCVAAAAIAFLAIESGPASADTATTHTITITSGAGTQFSSDGSSSWHAANVLAWRTTWPCDGGTWLDPFAGSSYVDFPGATDCATDEGSNQGFFRNAFTLPSGYTNASITVQWIADNAAQAYVNGTLIGGNPVEDDFFWSKVSTASSSDASIFHSGTNQLTLKLENLGGPAGLDFVATVTYTLPLPTATAQCKDDGWKSYGVFRNQGDCVSFVASKGKNAPAN